MGVFMNLELPNYKVSATKPGMSKIKYFDFITLDMCEKFVKQMREWFPDWQFNIVDPPTNH